jgi:hypothetical protein
LIEIFIERESLKSCENLILEVVIKLKESKILDEDFKKFKLKALLMIIFD